MPEPQDPAPPSDAAARIGRSIVLVGLMGAGKTSIGRLLAERLGLPFVDSDAEIERAGGAAIDEIFVLEGEATFRSGERRVIARLLSGPPAVIATGGGAYLDPTTRATVRERAVSVWLKANLDTLVKRTSRRGGRPLLKRGDPRKILASLIDERYPVYGEADLTVETGEESPEIVVKRVLAALEAHLGAGPLVAPAARRDAGTRGHPRHRRTRRRRPGGVRHDG
ncbi:MAG: shikimate kinase [Alphaproteobacteria bacterium]|nr:shikimate kinase [Alphaproteobacteria bacterium]